MKKWSILIGAYCMLLLVTGCIAETYERRPPEITISHPLNLTVELAKGGTDWRGEGGDRIKKEWVDVPALAKIQKQIIFIASDKSDVYFDHNDFDRLTLQAFGWKDGKKVEFKVEQNEETDEVFFYWPDESGQYALELRIHTDHGDAQYVGNIKITGE